MQLIILKPVPCDPEESTRLDRIWDSLTENENLISVCFRTTAHLRRELQKPQQLRNSRVLVLAAIGTTGINLELMAMLREIRLHPDCLEGSIACMIVDGGGEDSTKSVGKHIAWTLNMAGALLPGRPLVEGTGSLMNHQVLADRWQISRAEAYARSAQDLLQRLLSFRRPGAEEACAEENAYSGERQAEGEGDLHRKSLTAHSGMSGRAKLLCLHASNKKTSNTLRLWGKVRRYLTPDIDIKEIPLRNGEIRDCIGCHYDTCMYFSRQSSCYFGGTIVEEVYPALAACDALVMLCPNYNDAIGANLTATINRLTALFRKMPFNRKYLFALIVSGYSGGDIVGRQLIGALNMNKSFILPPRFALMEMANTAGSIELVPDIDAHAAAYADHIREYIV